MHEISIPEEVRLAIAERRGRAHAFDELHPTRTALLVVDMQNHFVAEAGLSEVPKARGIVANIDRLASALRDRGGTVVWVRSTFTHEGRGAWPMFFANFIAPEREREVRSGLLAGTWGHRFAAGLEPLAGDPVVDKDRFSPFSEGASDVAPLLRGRGIDTVVVSGTMTNVCCESTARDAMMADFRTIMVDDANAARTDEAHVASLVTFASVFGDVRSTADVIALLDR
ncbi:MAG: cysteine hydrolase [Acidimicrobiia bacterium]|nr:cysteine hydrolase [Acidimicrobiia bacterium]